MKVFNYVALTVVVAAVVGFGSSGFGATGQGSIETEQVLLTSGFKVQPARTPAQRSQLRALPPNQFTMVKQNGKEYYLYPDKSNNRLYAGDHYAYQSFQNYFKNKGLREKGVLVWEVKPVDRSNNTTIQVWHDWSPFDQWR
jgi:hypothetical protein